VQVSAKTGAGVDKLLDSIIVQAEIMELKAVADGPATGFVLESSLEKGRGVVATVLVQRAKLKTGDILLADTSSAACAPCSTSRRAVEEPALPCRAVLGLSGTPNAATRRWWWPTNARPVRSRCTARQVPRREAGARQGAKLEDVSSS